MEIQALLNAKSPAVKAGLFSYLVPTAGFELAT
jgi:hypothetical protein